MKTHKWWICIKQKNVWHKIDSWIYIDNSYSLLRQGIIIEFKYYE